MTLSLLEKKNNKEKKKRSTKQKEINRAIFSFTTVTVAKTSFVIHIHIFDLPIKYTLLAHYVKVLWYLK